MTVYGPATGNYSASSIRQAKSKNKASAGDQLINGKFIDNTGGTDNYKNSTNSLRAAVSGTTTGNTSGLIEDMYDEQSKSQIAQLKAAIQSGISQQQTVIDKAPQTYRPLKNQSEVLRNTDLRTALEQSANAGDRGGVGRQNALETQTGADNRLNNLNLQQQNVIDTANQGIADLNSSQSTSEAQIKADNNVAKLKAMIEQSQTDAATAKSDAINSIGAYSNDYMAQINKLTSDGDISNDWLIPYLQSARNTKISDSATSQAAADQQAFDNYIKQKQVDYTTSKPYYKPTSSSGGTSGSLTNSQIISAYSSGLIDEDQANSLLGIGVAQPTQANYYSDVENRLSSLTIPSSKVALIKTYNQQGKITDAQAQALLSNYGLD